MTITPKGEPHKHAEIIKAWADGATIQYLYEGKTENEWVDWEEKYSPSWMPEYEYRVKPEPKEDIVMYTCAYPWREGIAMSSAHPNLRLTFNPEGTKLLLAEVL